MYCMLVWRLGSLIGIGIHKSCDISALAAALAHRRTEAARAARAHTCSKLIINFILISSGRSLNAIIRRRYIRVNGFAAGIFLCGRVADGVFNLHHDQSACADAVAIKCHLDTFTCARTRTHTDNVRNSSESCVLNARPDGRHTKKRAAR